MREWARGITPVGEVGIVVGLAFGPFLLGNLSLLFSVMSGAGMPDSRGTFDAGVLRDLLGFELIILCLLGWFLHLRDWTLARLGLEFRLSDLPWAVGLLLACHSFAWLATRLVLGVDASYAPALTAPPDAALIAAVSFVNPMFEELFVCGYLIARLSELKSVQVAANVSLAIRLTYHLYQGSLAVVSILPVGIVFTVWFARTRRLWPVILAHAALDWFALSAIAGASR